MTSQLRALLRAAGVAAALVACSSVCAQSSTYPGTGSSSSRKGETFIGIVIGKPTYETSCGNIPGLSCANNGTSVSVTAGNMFMEYFGAELTYLNLGSADGVDQHELALGRRLLIDDSRDSCAFFES